MDTGIHGVIILPREQIRQATGVFVADVGEVTEIINIGAGEDALPHGLQRLPGYATVKTAPPVTRDQEQGAAALAKMVRHTTKRNAGPAAKKPPGCLKVKTQSGLCEATNHA